MPNDTDIQLTHIPDQWMRVCAVAPGIFRIRMNATGKFAEPPLIRYGFIRLPDPEFPAADHDLRLTAAGREYALKAGHAALRVNCENGMFAVTHGTSQHELRTVAPPCGGRRFALHLSLAEDEVFYGLGNLASAQIQRRGLKVLLATRNQLLESSPIPFLMSSHGWAIHMNTTWKHTFDIGCSHQTQLSIEGPGELDFFIFTGKDYAELLDLYTSLSGKPPLLPLWMYGFNFCSRDDSNAKDILEDALKFRRAGTPCDLIGLSKGWTETPDDASTLKQWHPERFPTSDNPLLHKITFIGILQKQGFKLSLGISCDYDLTEEEEYMTAVPTDGRGEPKAKARPFEPCYKHLQKFVDDGVSAFYIKVMPSVYDEPARSWSNGMSSEELHNLYAVMFSKQMYHGFREQTGTRPVILIEKGYTGMQAFVISTTGDYFHPKEAITAVLNYGLSGHANTTTNVHINTREGIHADLLLASSRAYSSQQFVHPDFLEFPLNRLFQTYVKLRYRLLPYIYSTARVAAATGMPIVRAMPLMYPDDANCRTLHQQYMLGDYLLVAAHTNEVYLPAGEWIDYWTGHVYNGKTTIAYTVPDHAGGALFIRAGAILPMWPVMDYIDTGEHHAHNRQTIILHIYPDRHRQSSFTLYEDDGITLDYTAGAAARTSIQCQVSEQHTILQIGRRVGSYKGMPMKRDYEIWLHDKHKPTEVKVHGEKWPESAGQLRTKQGKSWRYDRQARAVQLFATGESADTPGGVLPRPGDIALQIECLHPPQSLTGDAKRIPVKKPTSPWANLEAKPAMATRPADSGETGGEGETFGETGGETRKHPVIRQVMTIIDQEYEQDLSLKNMALRVSLHPVHLSRLFSKQTGKHYSDVVLTKRMNEARKLLEAGYNVYEAAAQTGFKDAGNFSKAFLKYWGKAPVTFKKS